MLNTFTIEGQFGVPGFSVVAFVGFLIAVIASTLDSVGDYFALAKASRAPLPPSHAINRGIFLEGMMGILSGAMGTGHATTSFNINIAIVDITQVASRYVLILAGLVAAVISLLGKFSAIMSALPDPVLGGVVLVALGIIPGLGNVEADQVLKVMLGTHMFLGAIISTLLDNTVSGTKEERGILQRDIETKNSQIRNECKLYNFPGAHAVQSRFKIFRY
ncbi:hypothetical protein KUTeg_015308, partial [Tegillarca granosa]